MSRIPKLVNAANNNMSMDNNEINNTNRSQTQSSSSRPSTSTKIVVDPDHRLPSLFIALEPKEQNPISTINDQFDYNNNNTTVLVEENTRITTALQSTSSKKVSRQFVSFGGGGNEEESAAAAVNSNHSSRSTKQNVKVTTTRRSRSMIPSASRRRRPENSLGTTAKMEQIPQNDARSTSKATNQKVVSHNPRSRSMSASIPSGSKSSRRSFNRYAEFQAKNAPPKYIYAKKRSTSGNRQVPSHVVSPRPKPLWVANEKSTTSVKKAEQKPNNNKNNASSSSQKNSYKPAAVAWSKNSKYKRSKIPTTTNNNHNNNNNKSTHFLTKSKLEELTIFSSRHCVLPNDEGSNSFNVSRSRSKHPQNTTFDQNGESYSYISEILDESMDACNSLARESQENRNAQDRQFGVNVKGNRFHNNECLGCLDYRNMMLKYEEKLYAKHVQIESQNRKLEHLSSENEELQSLRERMECIKGLTGEAIRESRLRDESIRKFELEAERNFDMIQNKTSSNKTHTEVPLEHDVINSKTQTKFTLDTLDPSVSASTLTPSSQMEQAVVSVQKSNSEANTPSSKFAYPLKDEYAQRTSPQCNNFGHLNHHKLGLRGQVAGLRTALGARQSLLNELRNRISKAHEILNHHHGSTASDPSMTKSDLRQIIKTHQKFLRWLNIFTLDGVHDIQDFEKNYIFNESTKVCYYYEGSMLIGASNDNLIQNKEEVEGIFIPLDLNRWAELNNNNSAAEVLLASKGSNTELTSITGVKYHKTTTTADLISQHHKETTTTACLIDDDETATTAINKSLDLELIYKQTLKSTTSCTDDEETEDNSSSCNYISELTPISTTSSLDSIYSSHIQNYEDKFYECQKSESDGLKIRTTSIINEIESELQLNNLNKK